VKAGTGFVPCCHVTTLVITEPTRNQETAGHSGLLKAEFERLDIEEKNLTKKYRKRITDNIEKAIKVTQNDILVNKDKSNNKEK
jgi:hypothetical protein